MQTDKYRKNIKLLFGIGTLFIVLALIGFYNAFYYNEEKTSIGVIPMLFGILSFVSYSYLYLLTLKITDSKSLEDYIGKRITEEKNILLSELQKEDETKEEELANEDNFDELIKEIIPSGNFKKLDAFGKKLLTNLANQFNLVQAILYKNISESTNYQFVVGYGLTNEEPIPDFESGNGLNGEAVKNRTIMLIEDIPEDYFTVESGLGSSKPGQLIIIPIVSETKTIAVLELASFTPISEKNIKTLEKFSDIVSNNFNQLYKA